jgi:hypothetical protein
VACIDGEEAPVRDRRSGRGGRISGRGELHGDMELVMGSGNNRIRLPPVGCSQRKTIAGELSLPGFVS